MSKSRVEARIAAFLGAIAVLGMLLCTVGASLYDEWLRSPWGDDGLQHIELVEVLPCFFWFAVWFGLLLGRRGVARVVCSARPLCWAVAGGILGKVAFDVLVGDLATAHYQPNGLSLAATDAAAQVISGLCTLVGAAAGAAIAWQLPPRLLPGWFSRRK